MHLQDEFRARAYTVKKMQHFTHLHLELEKNMIKAKQRMPTNLPVISASGDIVPYNGNIKLIAPDFTEAAIPLQGAIEFVNPDNKVKVKYSSSTWVPGALCTK